MLSKQTIETVISETLTYWTNEVKKPEVYAIATGKEIGHKLADLVDEKTTALLTVNHLTAHQRGPRGDNRVRSMGDLWLYDHGIYHPVNVKTGIVGSEGQPNLVSLKKVLSAVMARQIDSYYLLMVKMRLTVEPILPAVYFVDMLDWLDYVTFDSGPGQLMLKANRFFSEYDPTVVAKQDIREKVTRLMNLYEDGERRLRENRERDLDRFRRTFAEFQQESDFLVTPETQRSLRLE